MVYEAPKPEPAGTFPMVYEAHKPEPTSPNFPEFTKGQTHKPFSIFQKFTKCQTWVRDLASGLSDLVFDLKILYVTYDQNTELAFWPKSVGFPLDYGVILRAQRSGH